MRFFFFLLTALCAVQLCMAQPATNSVQDADKILAVVGKNRIILNSELEQQAAQMRMQDSASFNANSKCDILYQMMLQKMLVEQAERDSVVVSDDQLEGTLDNRVRYFTRQYGSKERMEEAIGKTTYQLKEEYRDVIRESLMAEQMQEKILRNVKITPGEVQVFYSKIAKDSLPFFPAALEAGQIVIEPKPSAELDSEAKKDIQKLRRRIVEDKESFETLAIVNSQDPGSRDNGGLIQGVTREGYAPEFVTAAYRLQPGEVSPVVKTQFGYHIIQMVQRKGEEVDVRHILIRPERSSADYQAALTKLDSVRAQLITGKISFSEAVGKYSTDDASRTTGGMIADPQTGATQLQVDQLDPSMALMMDSLKVGSYSQPQLFKNERGETSARIVFLKSRTAPHKANLTDDYNRIQQVALGNKKQDKLQSWLSEKIPTYYIKVDPAYQSCPALRPWVERMGKQ